MIHNSIESTSTAHALLRPMGVGGVYTQTDLFEAVIDGLNALISSYRPWMPRSRNSSRSRAAPRSKNRVISIAFRSPRLREVSRQRAGEPRGGRFGEYGTDWPGATEATHLVPVLAPAACYPVYPMVVARRRRTAGGLRFDVTSDYFRHEGSHELGRFQSLRMQEYVCVDRP